VATLAAHCSSSSPPRADVAVACTHRSPVTRLQTVLAEGTGTPQCTPRSVVFLDAAIPLFLARTNAVGWMWWGSPPLLVRAGWPRRHCRRVAVEVGGVAGRRRQPWSYQL